MSPHAYTEDQLVEQPAIGLLAELGWQTVSAMEETFGAGGTLGRETKGEVVLVGRLRAALVRLNPGIPAEAIQVGIDELVRDRSAMSLVAANREIYQLLKHGIPISVPDAQNGGQRSERLRVVDWEQPEHNDFLLVSQLSVVGSLYTCRPDLVGFVNGLPWVVVELKKPGVPARSAFDENLTHYKQQIPQLFWTNALLIASNGTDSRVGSLTADWGRFFEWKRVEREDEPRRVSLEVMLRGACDRARLLDLAENFTLFSEHKAGLVKVLGQNHQVLGVNNAIASMQQARQLGHGRGGVFWQTQGSGKSFSMVFFAQKVLRKLVGNWSFVIVTDRVELDDQIAKTFKAVGAVSQAEGDECHARSGAHLRKLLAGNHRYVFTLVHKFQTSEPLCDRNDLIVLTDEAHRSQYDTLALNMRAALPKATFLAFTGTPLIAGEERTKEVFGDYVSIYDFQQSVEDGATVPLFYENRTPELKLANPAFNDEMHALIEAAGLDPEREVDLEQELRRQYHILTRDDRLDTVAKDIVRHFLGRGFVGKAMVVSIDKATALRMHDKVQAQWAVETERVERELARLGPTTLVNKPQKAELQQRLDVLKSTDMALIVSPGQNEIADMRKLGLDIEPHRRRMTESKPGLDEKFKDAADPLRLVFVCAMWLTGFDAPSCSTVYLDKPMRNHTLMQTIARANRVFPGKHSGVIVDYANVFASLEQALAIYGAGRGGHQPVKDKQKLVDDLRQALAEASTFCGDHGVKLAAIEALPAIGMERLAAIGDAVNALIGPDDVRRDFFAHDRVVRTLYAAIKPDPAALDFSARVACIAMIADEVRAQLNPDRSDIATVLSGIGKLLDRSILGVEVREVGPPALDLSKINFEALAKQFRESKQKNIDLEALKAAVRARLDRLIERNPTRADFAEQFQELIDSYNAGSQSIEELFQALVELSRSLGEEDRRHVRENLGEEELVIFDILTRPSPELSAAERDQVKKVARELLVRLKSLLVLDWRKTAASRAKMRLAIEDALDTGLPRAYTPELYDAKCKAVFEHVFEVYPNKGQGVFGVA
jgi:type I restriction enzyme R subunit